MHWREPLCNYSDDGFSAAKVFHMGGKVYGPSWRPALL